MTDSDKLMIDRPFVNPFYNEAVGRRTGWVQKKEARKDSDGFEIFDDYWSDSDQSSLSVEATNKQNRTRNKTLDPVVTTPNIRKSSPLKAMSSFSTEHLSTEKSSKSCVTSDNASEVVTPKAVLEEDGLQGSLSKVDTSNAPNSALQSFKTKKRLTFSAAEHRVQRRTLDEQEENQPKSIDVEEQCEQEEDNLDKTLVNDSSDHETTASQVVTSNEANVETECIIHNEIQLTSQHVPISFRKTRDEAERSHQSTSICTDDIDSDFVSFKKKSVTQSTNFEDNDDDDYDFEIIDIDTTVYSQESGSNEKSRTSKDKNKRVTNNENNSTKKKIDRVINSTTQKVQTAKKSDGKKGNRTKKKKIAEVARWDEEENDKNDLPIEVTGHQKKKKETLMNKKNESGSSSDIGTDSNLSNVRTRRRNKKQDSLQGKSTKTKTNKKSEIRWDEEDDESDLGSDLPVEATGQKKKETLRNKEKKSESGSSSDIATDSNLSNVRTRRRNKKQESLQEKSTKTKTNKKSEIRWDEDDDESDLGTNLPVEATGQTKKETLRNKEKKSESGSSSDIGTDSNLSNVRTRRRNKKQDSLRGKSTKTKTNKKSESRWEEDDESDLGTDLLVEATGQKKTLRNKEKTSESGSSDIEIGSNLSNVRTRRRNKKQESLPEKSTKTKTNKNSESRWDEDDDESDLGTNLPVEATGQKKRRETLMSKKNESGSSDIESDSNLSNVRTRRKKKQDSLREKSTKTKTNKKLSTQVKSSKKTSELEDDLSTCSSELQDKANKKNIGKLGIGDVNDDEKLVTSKRTESKEKARQKERRNTKVIKKSGTVSEDSSSKRQKNNSNEESESSSSVVNAIHEDDHLESIQNDLSEGQIEETPLKNDIHEEDHLEPIQNDLSEGQFEETPLNRRTRNNRKQLITNKTAKNKQQKSGKISKEDKLVEKSHVSDSTNLETVVVEDMPINSKPKKNSIKKSGLTYSDGTNNVTEKFVVTDVTKSTKTRRSRRKLSKTLEDEENNATESKPRKRSKSLYNPENILLEEPENNLENSHKSEMTTNKKNDKSKSAKQRHTTLNRRKSSVKFSLGDELSSTSIKTNTKSNRRKSILKSSVSPINTKEPEDDSVDDFPLEVTKTSGLCHTSMGDLEDEFDEHVLPSAKKTSLKRQHEQSIDFYEIDEPMLAELPVSGKHKRKKNRRYKELATSSQDGNKTDVLAYSQFGDEDMLPEHKSTPVADTTGSSDLNETEPTASQDESKRANWTLKFFEVPKKKAFIINPEVYNDGTRRTKRSRVKPLEYWRNERPLYSRRQSGGFALSGIMSPTLPTPSPPAAKPKRKAKRKIPQTPHNLSIHANPSDIEEHIEVNPTITVMNPSTNEEVDIDAIATSEMNRFFGPTGKPVTSDDPIAMSKSLYQKSFSAGELLIRPLQKKGLQVVRNDTMVFRIIRGKLAVTIHETTTILESGARFFVPKGNVYNIRNLRNDEAKLDFIQVKSI